MLDIDKEILMKVKDGDLEAFEFLLSFYEKAIFNYCLHVMKNMEDAKDITQDTFIKVYKNRKLIDEDKNIKTWIFTIATNTAYDSIRKKKRKNEITLNEEDETISSIEAYYGEEGVFSDVEKALSKINTEYRKVLVLFYREGFSYQDIADMLLVPINTVKTHLSRGKEQLKEFLKDYGKN